ncbi:MAG: NUDIX domain-containing protein [Actinomycetota bacterium]|nr:NUDIX domain-containing protein [Actinomycetota bacterium]
MPSYYRDQDAPLPNRPRNVGVCFIVEIDGGVLIDTREDDGSQAFTGGTLEEGESVHEALARELSEETGLEIGDMTLLGVFSDPSRIVAYRDGAVHRLLSLAFVVTPKPGTRPRASDESLELRIVSRAELRDLAFWPAHRPIRDAYLAFDGDVFVA